MSTIEATLEPGADGMLHVPLPPGVSRGRWKVTATLQPADSPALGQNEASLKGFGCLKGRIWIAPDFDAPLEDFREYME